MQPHLRCQFSDPASNLDESKSQGVELRSTRTAFDQLPPQSVHQPVGAGVQEQAELVGYEAVAAEAIRLYVEL